MVASGTLATDFRVITCRSLVELDASHQTEFGGSKQQYNQQPDYVALR